MEIEVTLEYLDHPALLDHQYVLTVSPAVFHVVTPYRVFLDQRVLLET